MITQWKSFVGEDAKAFMTAVHEKDFPLLHEDAFCQTFLHPLDFFDGYDLIRVSNRYSPPFILFDYLSNGENHYYLDGSDHAFQTICRQGSVRITEDNVLAYIDLYFTYVYERGNSIVFIRDPQDTNFKGSDGMGVHFKALQKHKDLNVKYNAKRDVFVIKAPLLYQNKTRQGVITVHKDGRIDVSKPLDVSFIDEPKVYSAIAMPHPKAAQILEQTRNLIIKTQAGERLLAFADKENVKIHILGSPNYQAVTDNDLNIYLFMPAAQYTADYHQALQLVGALRDAEQIAHAYPRPGLDESEEVFFAVSYDKNLNMLCEICKIVEELDTQGIGEALSALRRLGIEDIYRGYKNSASPTEMLDIYIKMMEKQGFIVPE